MSTLSRLALVLALLGACADQPGDPDQMGDDSTGGGGDEGSGSGSGSGSDTVTPEPEPEPGHVNVVVTSPYSGQLQSGRRVIFSRNDGSVASDTVTDANGLASAELDDGYVTIVRDGSTGPSSKVVQTVLDVHAGDTVRFGPDPGTGSIAGYATFTHDTTPADHALIVHTPCDSSYPSDVGATSGVVEVREGASCRTNIPVISAAGTYDNNNFSWTPQLFSVASAQSMMDGAMIAMPAWTPALTTQLTMTGFPSGIQLLYGLQATMLVGGSQMFSQYNQSSYYQFNGTSTTTWKRPQGFGDNFLFEAFLKNNNDTYLGHQMFAIKTSLSDTLSVPYTNLAARWLLRPYIVLPGQTSAAKLAWGGDGSDNGDIAWLSIGYGNTTHGVAWSIIGPAPTGAAGYIQLPALPDDLKMLELDSVSTARIALIAVDGASYADLREHLTYHMANAIELDWYDTGSAEAPRNLAKLPNVTGVRMSLSPRP